mmetsp:Transcript_17207/g.15214  ORF Transcript_17207/g.15214 Transcript_17207/m.15214 type:complete len:96 (-) Transcript_17207:5-292(-)
MSAPPNQQVVPAGRGGPRPKAKSAKKKNIYKGMNPLMKIFYIIKNFSGKIMWFSACVGFMYFVPINYLLFKDQEMILSKMAMSGGIPGMGPPGAM